MVAFFLAFLAAFFFAVFFAMYVLQVMRSNMLRGVAMLGVSVDVVKHKYDHDVIAML